MLFINFKLSFVCYKVLSILDEYIIASKNPQQQIDGCGRYSFQKSTKTTEKLVDKFFTPQPQEKTM